MAEVTRELIHYEGKPALVIKPKVERMSNQGKRFLIRLNDLWKYSEDHNPNFEMFMFNVCIRIHALFDLGLISARKVAEIATVIEEGIDDLVKMKPEGARSAPARAFLAAIGDHQLSLRVA